MPINSFVDFPMSWAPNRMELNNGPTYLALAAKLESDISSGLLPAGTKLPPQRELADFLDINFSTVTRAFDICREKGLIYGVVGRGTFVAELERQYQKDLGTIDCAVVQGFSNIGCELVTEAAKDVLNRSLVSRLFSYAERDGRFEHREAGCRWLERAGVKVDPECVSVFPGVQSALSTALLSIFRAGEALAVDSFTYSNLIHLARLAHVRLVAIEGDNKGMLPAALQAAVEKDSKIRGVFLMPYCANPTTITLSERRKDEIAKIVQKFKLIVLEDDVRLSFKDSRVASMFARLPERTIYLAGSVRLVAPGLRVTYVAYPKDYARQLESGLHHLAIKASALEAEILSELVVSGKADKILEMKLNKARAANEVYDKIFGSDKGDSGRMFRCISLPNTCGRGREIEESLANIGVRVCHSDRFAVRSNDTRSFLRVSVSSASGLSQLRRALECVARYML